MIEQIMDIVRLATVFGGVGLVIAVFFWGVKTSRGCRSGVSRQQLEDETRLLQEMYRGLTKMEERINILETILLEKQKYKPADKDTENEQQAG